jgi:hypothetical protein
MTPVRISTEVINYPEVLRAFPQSLHASAWDFTLK